MKKFLSTCFVAALLLGSTACEKFLEEDPKGQVATGAFYNTVGEATQAVTGVYTFLRPLYLGNSMTLSSEMASDAFTFVSGAGGALVTLYENFQIVPTDQANLRTYQAAYQLINAANTVLANLQGKTLTGTPGKQPILEGEALFLRALTYYHLVQLYGDLPLRTEPSTSVVGLDIPRSPAAKVFETIVADLQKAVAKLPERSEAAGRANKLAALTLLAKVQLSLKQPEAAVASLKQVIGKRSLYKEYGDNFKLANENNTVESIFEVQYGLSPFNNDVVQNYTPVEVTGVGFVFQVYAPSKEALALLTPTDKRTPVTLWSSFNGKPFVQPFVRKFNDALVGTTQANDAGQINWPVFRYADVLLLYAEALNAAQKGPSAEALDALNQVRLRAALPAQAAGLSQSQFVDALLDERLREFLGEGHRWFDLKRNDRLAAYLTKNGFKTGIHEVFPIPRAELDANKNMTQNQGY
jgi:hypothetical protein